MCARKLTKKQRKFVNEYADTGNGTKAALAAYETSDPRVAEVIGSENISKPIIVNALKELGFDSNNAKRVVGEILNDQSIEPQHRLKASEQVFKVQGSYAPDKSINLNVDAELTEDEGGIADILVQLLS